MDLDQLRTFRQVAAHGSITAAAQVLGYTQSAVSRQVSALEASIGASLFDRRARGVELTEQGRCLLPHAQAVLDRIGDARRDLEAIGRLEQGRLRVGAFTSANAALIPRALSRFRQEHPGVALSLVEGTSTRQLARLREGDIDLAVISAFEQRGVDREELELTHLVDDAMLVAVPASHRLAARQRVRLAELSDETWISAAATYDENLLGPASLRPRFEPRVDYVVTEWTAKLGLVAAGLGIAVVPSIAAEAARSDIALVALHGADSPRRKVYAATLRARQAPPPAAAFVAAIRATAR
jgi:DNA-binding transcriptional LysR family regulator